MDTKNTSTSHPTLCRKARRIIGSTGLAIALAAGAATAGENGLGGAINDATLTTEVKTRLMTNDTTRGININVDSKGGMVTLRGTVPNEAARQKAAEIALSVEGADSVTNALIVGDSSTNPQTLTAKTKKAGEQAGEAISDGWITTQVKTKLLADDAIKGLDIEVSTDNGQVVLAGLVPSESVREKAILEAHRVRGVHSVNAKALVVEQAE